MEIEHLAIRDFLAQSEPLSAMPEEDLNKICLSIEIRYLRKGKKLLERGKVNQEAMLIRSGAIEVYTAEGELYGQFGEGEWIGHRTLLSEGRVTMDVTTIEDTLFYCFPEKLFRKILNDHSVVDRFFEERKPDRVRQGIKDIYKPEKNSLLHTRLTELARPALQTHGDVCVRDVAKQMTALGCSCVLVVEDHKLIGIVTDGDFRKRVIATDGDIDGPVRGMMSTDPVQLRPTDSASEAMLLMTRRNIHHLAVIDEMDGGFVGVVKATDLLRSQSSTPIYMVSGIHLAQDLKSLKELSGQLPAALVGMVNSNLPAYDVGHAISSIGQAITRRLLEMAEEKFGPPPVSYCFVTAGSMGRREQTAHTDQDNAMILSDDFDPAKHDEYFKALADFVCHGLDACGYVYCPGDIMASNTLWRQPLSVWRGYFDQWINKPTEETLLDACVFFDMRWLRGDQQLLDTLHAEILANAKESRLFLAHMAKNALQRQPPLGLFKGLVLEKNGAGEKTLDLKLRGVSPVIDFARVRALAVGAPALNTIERLDAIDQEEGGMSTTEVTDLRDAFVFINTLRLHHQAKQIEQGLVPDNFLNPSVLSTLERRYLKDSFAVISDLQKAMARNSRFSTF